VRSGRTLPPGLKSSRTQLTVFFQKWCTFQTTYSYQHEHDKPRKISDITILNEDAENCKYEEIKFPFEGYPI
jgi:hypothetical protein